MDASRWQKIEDGIAVAAQVSEGERAAWLDQFCAGDVKLKSEIESLLAFETTADAFLENSFASLAAKILPEEENNLAGRQFGHYRIEREIGRGGMGAVFLARRSDGEFDQQVALKIVRQTIVDKATENQFRRERQILASLNHPNIARLLDGGVSDAGEPFLAMEFIEGETLLEYAEARKLSIEKRLKLFLKVCAGVAFAHRNLIVHRDIKPSNILIGEDGETKLLDFGLAKILDFETDSGQTATAFRALTPAYASPEQMRGEKITTASDIYSLGVLLYELLTGARPFDFKTNSFEEIVRLVSTSEPPRPSSVDDSKFKIQNSKVVEEQKNPKSENQNLKSLKGDLDNIVLKSLRKETERRYQSVEAFAADIERYLNGLPVSARPNTFKYRAGKFIKRNRIAVAAAVLIFLSLLGGIVVSLSQTRRARLEKTKAETVNAFLQTMLNASDPDNGLKKSNHDLTVKEVLDEASTRLAGEDLSAQPEIKADLQRIVGATYLSIGQYDLAEQNLNAALAAHTKIYGEDNLETLETLVLMGKLWVDKGDYARAGEFYRQRLSILRGEEKQGTISADYLFAALSDFALLQRAQGDSKEAETLIREALDLRARLSADAKIGLGINEGVLALTLADQGKLDEAEKIVAAKVESMRYAGTGETGELSANLTGLGSFQTEQGKFAEAERNLSEAETIYRKLYSRSNLQLGDNLRLQAQTLYSLENYAGATTKIDETLEIYRANTSAQYVNYPTALIVQGLILTKTGRAAEGEKILREAVKIRVETLPKEHYWIAVAKGALGENLMAQKRFDEAEPLLVESCESLKNSQGDESPRTHLAQNRLVNLYRAWNKPELAARYEKL